VSPRRARNVSRRRVAGHGQPTCDTPRHCAVPHESTSPADAGRVLLRPPRWKGRQDCPASPARPNGSSTVRRIVHAGGATAAPVTVAVGNGTTPRQRVLGYVLEVAARSVLCVRATPAGALRPGWSPRPRFAGAVSRLSRRVLRPSRVRRGVLGAHPGRGSTR